MKHYLYYRVFKILIIGELCPLGKLGIMVIYIKIKYTTKAGALFSIIALKMNALFITHH